MKKILFAGLLLLTCACQTATPTPEPPLFPTATVPASPTPVSASQTPEPTPTFEPSPTMLPRLFTNEFDSSLAGWVILQAGNETVPNVTTENNTLRLEMESPYTWLYVLYGPFEYEDIYIGTKYINSALSPASAGLVCHYSEEKGWLEYNLSTDGAYNVLYGTWLDTGIADYLPVIDGVFKDARQSGETQEIGLHCSDTILHLYINGNIIRSVDVSRFELMEGKVGLTASSYENTPVVVTFDAVTVEEP